MSFFEVPETVTTLGNQLFQQTVARPILMRPTTPPTYTTSTFQSNSSLIYVPDESYDDYMREWSDLSSRIHKMSEYPG